MSLNCYFEYIYEPITRFRKTVFEKLISKVVTGSLLDLGCGQVGEYWALGYSHRVDSIDFFDYHTSNIHALSDKIDSLSPDLLQNKYSDTIAFLKTANIIPATINNEELATNVITKVRSLKTYNFLVDSSINKYDTVIAIESVECVDSESDFVLGLDNIASLLQPNGIFLGLILRYNFMQDYTNELISYKMEGRLNPDLPTIKRLFEQSNLQIDWIEIENLPEQHDYQQAIFVQASLIQ